MSIGSGLDALKAEEKALMRIESQLNDQLNRLEVEGLALQSMIRTTETQEEKDSRASSVQAVKQETPVDDDDDHQPILNLEVKTNVTEDEEMEEEEEEEDEDEGLQGQATECQSDVMSLLQHLEKMKQDTD